MIPMRNCQKFPGACAYLIIQLACQSKNGSFKAKAKGRNVGWDRSDIARQRLLGFVLMNLGTRGGWNPLVNFWTCYTSRALSTQRLLEMHVTPTMPRSAIRFRAFLDRFVSERSDNLQEEEAPCGLTFLPSRRRA